MTTLFQPHQDNRRLRQQLLGATQAGCGSISTIESLRSHLQTAIEIEHSTIPAYLTALYSINPGTNLFAYQTIQSVVMEEMLHMIQACNLLNAVGGHPAIDKPAFIPSYPTYLPHSANAFLVPLQKFSKETLDVFLNIEHPAEKSAPPQGCNYNTIGQFYQAIKQGLIYLDSTTGGKIFSGKLEHQITALDYYGGGGSLVTVRNLADALLAINEIIGQGEGMGGTIFDTDHELFGQDIEYAHYFKFNEIRQQRRYAPSDFAHQPPTGPAVQVNWDAVSPVKANCKLADYPVGSPLYVKTLEFNRSYTDLLSALHQACNGHPHVLQKAIPLMYDLKYKALDLMNIPLGNGEVAGPSFEYAVRLQTGGLNRGFGG